MNKWYWVREFGGNGISTLAILLFTFLFGGIAIVGSATFGSWFASPVMLPLLIIWAFVAADRLIDDALRYDADMRRKKREHSGLFWLVEIGGDVVMILGLAWVCMIVGTVSYQGYHTFVENNNWILWSEIPVLAAMGIAVALNWAYDVPRFRKERS